MAWPQAVLASHMGVVRLMDMMAEREAIRNEALLLLIRLTRDSVDIQKIAAFEGAFERVLGIVRHVLAARHPGRPRTALTLPAPQPGTLPLFW